MKRDWYISENVIILNHPNMLSRTSKYFQEAGLQKAILADTKP
jgi:hypothetical protein